MIRINHQLFTPLLVLFMVISGYNTSYSETYTDSMGNELTQEQYEKRLSLCYDVKSREMIPSDTNCENWVLSDEAIIKLTMWFLAQENLKK